MRQAKFSVAIHERDLETVVSGLTRLEGLDLLEPEQREGMERWRELGERLERQRRRLEDLLSELGAEPRERPPSGPGPSEEAALSEERLAAAEEALRAWREERDALGAEGERASELAREAQELAEIGVSAEELDSLERIDVTFGWMPREELDNLEIPLSHRPLVIVASEPAKKGRAVLVAAAAERGRGFVLDQVLRLASYHPLGLLETAERARGQDAERRLREVEDRRQELAARKETLARQWREPLASALARVQDALRSIALLRRSAPGGAYYFMSGYVADEKTGELVALVDGAAAKPHAICVGHG